MFASREINATQVLTSLCEPAFSCYQNGHNNQFYEIENFTNTEAVHVRTSFHIYFTDFV